MALQVARDAIKNPEVLEKEPGVTDLNEVCAGGLMGPCSALCVYVCVCMFICQCVCVCTWYTLIL